MAFKPIRMSDSAQYISGADPAIDWDGMVAAECETNEDIKKLNGIDPDEKYQKAMSAVMGRIAADAIRDPQITVREYKIKDGKKPTVFVIGSIPPSDYNVINDKYRSAQGLSKMSNQMLWACFLSGLRNIENWEGDVPKIQVNGIDYVDPEWIKSTFVRTLRPIGIMVGQAIALFNELSDDEVKN